MSEDNIRPISRYIDSAEIKGAEKSPPHPIHKAIEWLLCEAMIFCGGLGWGYYLWG